VNLYILAWVVVGGFFLLTGLMMLIPELDGRSNNAMVNIMFGGLVSGFATVLGYFFGSSKGSTDKTQLLAANGRK
jgi:dolichol kinase